VASIRGPLVRLRRLNPAFQSLQTSPVTPMRSAARPTTRTSPSAAPIPSSATSPTNTASNGTDLVTVGYGKSKPKDPNAPMDPINRRVEVVNMDTKTASK
jgi:hypothetical protein